MGTCDIALERHWAEKVRFGLVSSFKRCKFRRPGRGRVSCLVVLFLERVERRKAWDLEEMRRVKNC